MLWAEPHNAGEPEASVRAASLTSPAGNVPIRIVGPETPTPATLNWSFGWGPTVGGDTTYIVVPHALKPASDYTLSVTWAQPNGATYPQIVSFRTVSSTEAATEPWADACGGCQRGRFQFSTRGDTLDVALSPAAGQRVSISVGFGGAYCLISRSPCPEGYRKFWIDRTVTDVIHHFRHQVTVRLPGRNTAEHGDEVTVNATRFTAGGYQWSQPNSLVGYIGASWRSCAKLVTPGFGYACRS